MTKERKIQKGDKVVFSMNYKIKGKVIFTDGINVTIKRKDNDREFTGKAVYFFIDTDGFFEA